MAPFIEGKREAAEAKWDEIEDPATALSLYLKVAEFVHPKRAAIAVTGEDGGPIEFVIRDLAKES